MKVLGLIVEYNPFHHGHLYHLQQSVKKTGADVVVAVMSGSFLQRGEPALVNKWSRTKMALQGGVDVVVELPYIHATQKAEIFADGAVALLQALSVTDLCFGSENGEIEPFKKSVQWLSDHQELVNERIKIELEKGKSYPRAFSDAYLSINETDELLDLSQPNNILGFHYVQSVIKRHSSMRLHTITRTGSHYHDQQMTDNHIASATAIRNNLLTGTTPLSTIQPFVPEYTFKELENYLATKGSFHNWEDYFIFLRYKLISESAENLKLIYECEEGLEHRLKREIIKANSFEDFIQKLKTKRYTRTRLQRLLVHLYLNTSKEFMEDSLRPQNPPYIRILGMSQNGRKYLSQTKKERSTPLFSKASESNDPIFQKDVVASRLHGVIHPNSSFMDEFQEIPIMYNEDLKQFLS
ncbi:nucleotidyltransferase [Salipaludibacillus daqingensis]|uniref:nucleotidyltransferase n=1 Tax=Salipaludibacillus daqingensis TaxID=3041001 RepID=UPI002475B80C|nr:nucleotidyltransferase [Salipaludibacillus daqingensis]